MEWHVVSLQEPFWARAIRCETKLHCMERVGRILLVVVAVAKSEPSGEKYPSRHFAVQTGRWIFIGFGADERTRWSMLSQLRRTKRSRCDRRPAWAVVTLAGLKICRGSHWLD